MTPSSFRTVSGGASVDRTRPVRFSFDNVDYTGLAGDTLASALLASGVHRMSTSIRLGRPRGVLTAGWDEPDALVQVDEPFPEVAPATVLEVHDGLVAHRIGGQGLLSASRDLARYDAVRLHCEVLVVGAGPAGLAATEAAAGRGDRVVLVDDQPAVGGSLLGTAQTVDGVPGAEWALGVRARLDALPDVRVLTRTSVLGHYDDNFLLAVERRTAHLGADAPAQMSRERVWRIRAGRVVHATGAHERLLGCAGNDVPGVLLVGAARSYAARYGVLVGQRAVVVTADDSAYAAVVELVAAGLEVAALVDTRPAGASPDLVARLTDLGVEVHTSWGVVGLRSPAEAGDGSHVEAVRIAPIADGAIVGASVEVVADTLLLSGGWTPVLSLWSHAGGSLVWDAARSAHVPGVCRQRVEVVGTAAGASPSSGPAATTWLLPTEDGVDDDVVLDRARDVTVGDVLRATGAGLTSLEHVKRYTTAGTGSDQGRTVGLLVAEVVARATGSPVGAQPPTTARPPYVPVSFATLAGRDRGVLSDPVRVTSLHDWHVSQGAVFEDVGQWKRPWYFPRDGEDLDAAVLRECRAAREGVAFMDASTLGKIELQGPDVGAFLDLIYTNLMSSLAVGSVRYGVMCRPDGMVFDDGTVLRLGEDRWLVTTTTGNAAAVLDWMEEWLQTEWPELQVRATSVTEQWATIAVVGPGSRAVLASLAPSLAVDAEAFPFMTWRDAEVAGLPGRVARISFSGELAYELHVAWWHGRALVDAVAAAGEAAGITAYGTETMHVLRAEKGYPIVGQDTDGTVTPQDLGMGWVVSKKKADFLGKRSFARADTSRPDRRQLVGLLPVDGTTRLLEGGQVVAMAELPAPPVPMLGHVTSSYDSAALGRPFALALVAGGRGRIGERLFVTDSSFATVPVKVVDPVLVDPEGTRRDG